MFDGKSINYQRTDIENNGFWPNIDAGDFERSRTIPATADHSMVTNALLTAIAEINLSLEQTCAGYQAKGYLSASVVPGPVASHLRDNLAVTRNWLDALYIKAVYARAKADLLPEFATTGRRDSHPGQEAPESRRGLLTEATMAIRTIMARPRGSVSLID
ncbi:MAG: head completion/stabilization protein [Plesiomonas shigelloides]